MLIRKINSGLRLYRLSPYCRQQVNLASTSSVTSSEEKQEPAVTDPEAEASITELRDISRMRPWHRSILNGESPPIDTFKWQKERWALKERYAMYGRASGVDPAVCWPTAEELEEMRQEDEELQPKLSSTIEEMRRRREEREQQIEARYADVEQKAKEYPKIVEAYRKKLREQQATIDEEARIKDEKIKEIQSYFGYAIDVSDPRFSAMMTKKEMEEKQARKKQQKKEKDLEALRLIEEETTLLKQREQLQFQATKPGKSEEAQPKAKAVQ